MKRWDLNKIIGDKYHRLIIVEAWYGEKGEIKVKAICECGVINEYYFSNVKRGVTKSCGCLRRELDKTINRKKHGLLNHLLHSVWSGMKQRCYNSNCEHYDLYGGDGVTVCAEWKDSFQCFYDWAIENGYKKGLELDKGKLSPYKSGKLYSPQFCCFIPRSENAKYKRNSIIIEHNNIKHSLKEWAAILKLDVGLINNRYFMGWSASKILETPLKKAKLITYDGKDMTLREWSNYLKIEYPTLCSRIYTLKWDYDKAFTKTIAKKNIKNKPN